MIIQHEENGSDGDFFIEKDNERVATIAYTITKRNALIIQHTEVNKELQGNRIGFDLVKRVVEYAREKGIKIIPQCSFAKSVFEREQDFSDVLISPH